VRAGLSPSPPPGSGEPPSCLAECRLFGEAAFSANGAGGRLQDDGKREAQKPVEALLKALVLSSGAGKLEGLEKVGQAGERDEAGVVGEGRDPGEESAVGAVGKRHAWLRRREIYGQVGIGAEMGLARNRREGARLEGKAAEDERLGSEKERAGAVRLEAAGRIDGTAREVAVLAGTASSRGEG
jgi:hypothetical protein